jgi:hypothetical protein
MTRSSEERVADTIRRRRLRRSVHGPNLGIKKCVREARVEATCRLPRARKLEAASAGIGDVVRTIPADVAKRSHRHNQIVVLIEKPCRIKVDRAAHERLADPEFDTAAPLRLQIRIVGKCDLEGIRWPNACARGETNPGPPAGAGPWKRRADEPRGGRFRIDRDHRIDVEIGSR